MMDQNRVTFGIPSKIWLLTEFFLGVLFCLLPIIWSGRLDHQTLTQGLILSIVFLVPSEIFRQFVGPIRLWQYCKKLSSQISFNIAKDPLKQFGSSPFLNALRIMFPKTSGLKSLERKIDNQALLLFEVREEMKQLIAEFGGQRMSDYLSHVADKDEKKDAAERRAERLAAVAALASGLAHEIRNPLVAIKTFVNLLPKRIEDKEFQKHFLKIASAEVDRISSLLNELLEFARPFVPKLEMEDIHSVLDGMILLVSTELRRKKIQVVKNYAPDIPLVRIDREQIKQVFLNIFLNALEATPEQGKIFVRTRTFTKPWGEAYIQIEFTDTGCGIPKEHLEDIFNPFFSTKSKGSGLGLSISYQIIQNHRGHIEVDSQLNKGSSFFINLPAQIEYQEKATSWEMSLGFREGDIIYGKVTRLSVFGAFIEVAPGVEGFVPISEMSRDKIFHPKELFREGDMVNFLVMRIDNEKRQIYLSIKGATIKKGVDIGQLMREFIKYINLNPS